MKKIILGIVLTCALQSSAQMKMIDSGYIELFGGSKILVYKLDSTQNSYQFYTKNDSGKWIRNILNTNLVQQISPYTIANTFDSISNFVNETSIQKSVDSNTSSSEPSQTKYASFHANIGLAIGNFLEINSLAGTGDKTSFSLNGSLDLMYNYDNPNSIFNTSHEAHWTIGFQKESLGTGSDLQRSQDDVQTLHDIALAFTKKKKWRVNTIAKFSTSIFTIFDNNYFKDLSGNGRIQSIMSPYNLILSPGIQYQPVEPLKISVSPYSTELYGVTSDVVSSKGNYITELDGSGNFKKLITKRQSLEFNIWFDHRIKDWIEFQYRLGIMSNYQLGFLNNGAAEGLFITRLRIIKNVFLSHRLMLQSDIFNNLSNPYLSQNIQLSYTQNF